MNSKQQSHYYSNTRIELAGFLPKKPINVLEIGCGAGIFRQHFPVCNYWGVEYSPVAAVLAADNLDHVLTGTLDEVYDQLPDAYFDTIVCNDVIEHMPDHDAFFQKIKQKMTLDGKIYGSIPNVRHVENLRMLVFGKDWVYTQDGILDRTHLRFFTFKSLHRTLLQHDFLIETFQGINSTLPAKWYRMGLHSIVRRLFVLLFGSDSKYLQIYFIAALKKPQP